MENSQHCYSFYEKPEPLSRVVAYGTLLFAMIVVMCAAVGFHSILEWALS